MIKFSTLLLFFICLIPNSHSQSDTLNQFDSNGKKTGWWITYLDKNLKILEDSTGATHCMYNYYRKNIFLYRFGEGYGKKNSPIVFPENDTLKLGSYTLLHGIYLTKYKNGNLRSKIEAANGYMTGFKYYYPNGQLRFEVIISEACGAPAQHCIKEYHKDGRLKRESYTWLPKEE